MKLEHLIVEAVRRDPLELTFEQWLRKQGGFRGYMRMCDIHLDDYDHLGDNEKEIADNLKYEVRSRYDDVLYEIDSIPESVAIFRCISITNLNQLSRAKLGIYWSNDLRKAECHWGTGGESYIIRADVPKKDIDIAGTIDARMHWSTGEEEGEIRLHENVPIVITSVSKDKFKFYKARIPATT